MFGYGFRTYEFLPHPRFYVTDHGNGSALQMNATTPGHMTHGDRTGYNRTSTNTSGRHGKINAAPSQEISLGMYSLRSWMYPRIYVAAFKLHSWLMLEVSILKVCENKTL